MASAAASASLEKGLGQRSSASELLDRGVLKQGGVANSKVGAAKMLEEKMLKLALEKKLGETLRSGGPPQKIAESLEEGLAKRSTAAELKGKGVLKPVDGSIGGAAAALSKAQTADSLAKGIVQRSSASDLMGKGVLKPEGIGIDGSVASTAAALEKARLGDKMNKKIGSRASVFELLDKGVLRAEDADEAKEEAKEAVAGKLKKQLRRPSMAEGDAAVAAAAEEASRPAWAPPPASAAAAE